jgi:Uma2 family endonuclease
MATVESEPLLQPFESCDRLFTAADLELLPTDLPSGPIDYELDNGRLVFVMVPPGDLHGAVQSNIATELKVQGERRGHGKARTEVGIVLWRNPDRVVGADIAFIANKSLPIQRTSEGYLETVPELVVEIRSKNDSLKYVERKVRDYLKAGVQIVWVPDSTALTVTVHTTANEPTVYAKNDTLQLPDLIPDFSMAVAEVFRE